jgi:hypothetical protein
MLRDLGLSTQAQSPSVENGFSPSLTLQSPLLGIPKKANALNTMSNDGTIPETTSDKPWHLALRLHRVFNSQDYRVPRAYATRLREFLIHHTLATADIAMEAGMTMQVFLMFFVGLDGVTRVGRLKGVVTGRRGIRNLITQPQR